MRSDRSNPYRIVIMASGNGTNAERLIQYFAGSELAEVVLVLTNNSDAGVLSRSEKLEVDCLTMTKKVYADGNALCAQLDAARTDLLVLAGYLKLIPQKVVEVYASRIVNIHPSLLPAYGGKGMYGMRVHEAVIQAKDAHSGITIHQVNEHYDEGKVIRQESIAVASDWTAQDLAQAIHQLEYTHFPATIEELLQGWNKSGMPEPRN